MIRIEHDILRVMERAREERGEWEKKILFGPKWPNSLSKISKPLRNVLQQLSYSYELVPHLSRSEP